MDSEYFLDIKTDWIFPIIEYSVSASYIEVRRASGIEYILLRLINLSENCSETLADALCELGVPDDIRFIFGDALAGMISCGLIEMNGGREFEAENWDKYPVSEFKMTELGKKLFTEETIPTGRSGLRKPVLYFDPALKDTAAKTAYRLSELEDSPLDRSCFSDIRLNNSDAEEFISENAALFGFKKGETITGYRHNDPRYLAYTLRDAVNIRIGRDGMYIQAADKRYERYIREQYSADIITEVFAANNKFRFPKDMAEFVGTYNYSELSETVGVKMPCMLSEALEREVPLSFCMDNGMKKSGCPVDKRITKELFHKCGIEAYAGYFENGGFYRILIGSFDIGIAGHAGRCGTALIVTERLPDETADKLTELLYDRCVETGCSDECCDIIKAITEIKNDGRFLKGYATAVREKQTQTEEKARAVLSLHEHFRSVKAWTDIAADMAAPLFDELCGQITLDNFACTDSVTSRLKDLLNIRETDYLKRIYDSLKKSHNDMAIYTVFERAGHSVKNIPCAASVFGAFCTALPGGGTISAETRLGAEFAALGSALSELKEITGISDPLRDAAKADSGRESFLKAYAAFEKSYKKLAKYKTFAQNEFNRVTLFESRFSELKETMTSKLQKRSGGKKP